jgi:hypothetical protein
MNKVDKSLLDTDILSEIINRANPQIIANKRREQGTGNSTSTPLSDSVIISISSF